MSIQKKSLISSLKTTKKANVASSTAGEIKKGEKVDSLKPARGVSFKSTKLSMKSTRRQLRALRPGRA
jgi:hypothetical protein